MKYTINILISLFLFWGLTACSPYSSIVYEAESIMEDDPEKALLLLSDIDNPANNLSRKNYALFNVLKTQAYHKCYKDLAECTDINLAIDYYRTSKDSLRAAKAYFYGGVVAESSRNVPQAVEYYLKAKDLLAHRDEPKYQYMIRYYLGDVYNLQWLREDQLEIGKETVIYAAKVDDAYSLPLSYHKLGIAYAGMNYADSALYCQYKALSSLNNNSDVLLPDIYYHIWLLYREEEQIDGMVTYKDSLTSIIPNTPLSNSVIGDTYYVLNQLDSALIYLDKSLETNNLYIKAESSLKMADIYQLKGDYESSNLYLRKRFSIIDSIDKQMRAVAVIETKNINTQNHILEENLSLKETDLIKSKTIIILSVIVFLSSIVVILYVVWFRQKKLKHAQEKKDLLALKERESYILESKIMEVREECYELINKYLIPQFDHNTIRLSDDDWEIIYQNADALFDNFTLRLLEKHITLSEVDVRICCLMKMKMKPNMIAKILGIASSSISRRKYRIAVDKMGLDDGKSLENYIRTF